jgi:hypothetical protein
MQDDYDAIRKQHPDDTGVAGDVAENNWRILFERWLPSNLQYATKVRVLGVDGELSNEVDLVILDPAYPTPLLEKKQIISTGVVAAFECKLTLRASDFNKTFEKAKKAKSISGGFYHPQSLVSEHYVNLHGGFPYGVLAHSHE